MVEIFLNYIYMRLFLLVPLIALLIYPLNTDAQDTSYTLFYFGATSCGPCNRLEVIESINILKSTFSEIHAENSTKFVMVVMDEDISEGLEYLRKYETWDEVSIGSRYHNEHILRYLNVREIPGVPHILVFGDVYEDIPKFGTQLLKERTLLKGVMGGKEIVDWVSQKFPLEN